MDRHEFFGWVFIGASFISIFYQSEQEIRFWGLLILGNIYILNSKSRDTGEET